MVTVWGSRSLGLSILLDRGGFLFYSYFCDGESLCYHLGRREGGEVLALEHKG